jgi:DNA-binding response OmpR family regulator
LKLLLAEDDAELVDYLASRLKSAGYVVERADNGVDAEFLGLEEDFDGIILDLGLPERPGLEVLRNWRAQKMATPVLILTARGSRRSCGAVSAGPTTACASTKSSSMPMRAACRWPAATALH